MRQIFLQEPQKLGYADIDITDVPNGFALIKTARCGVCGTDAHGYMGETIFGKIFPFHIGHEVSGHIEKISGDSKSLKKGDAVVINPFYTCNSCKACYLDRSNDCENKTTIGLTGPGGFSEYILVPVTSIYKVSPNADLNKLCFAEPLATVIYGLNRLTIDHSKRVLINGVGAIGLMFLQLVAGLKPQSITVADFNEQKLKKASELGATHTINPKNEENNGEFEVIIDCTGSAKCVEQSIKNLAFGGQLLNFGVCASNSSMQINPFDLYKKDATLLFSFALNKSTMQKAINLLEGDFFNVDALIDSVQPLSNLEDSLVKMARGETSGKIIIDTTK